LFTVPFLLIEIFQSISDLDQKQSVTVRKTIISFTSYLVIIATEGLIPVSLLGNQVFIILIDDKTIYMLTFFDNRQNPERLEKDVE